MNFFRKKYSTLRKNRKYWIEIESPLKTWGNSKISKTKAGSPSISITKILNKKIAVIFIIEMPPLMLRKQPWVIEAASKFLMILPNYSKTPTIILRKNPDSDKKRKKKTTLYKGCKDNTDSFWILRKETTDIKGEVVELINLSIDIHNT